MRYFYAIVIGFSVSQLAGCGDAGRKAVSKGNLHELGAIIHEYHDEMGSFPKSFDQLVEFNPIVTGLLKNPRSSDSPGYGYIPPPARDRSEEMMDLMSDGAQNATPSANWSELVMAYEIQNGNRDPDGLILAADGRIRDSSQAD